MTDTQREHDVDEALMQAERDNEAVDQFAKAMKEKLAIAREKGRSGWDNRETCTGKHLADLFWKQTTKENKDNYIDLANFLMFLHVRGVHENVLRYAKPCCNTCGNAPCFNEMWRMRDSLDLDIVSCKFWYGKDKQ
ncbi:MAG: hypothetical protein PHE60_07610 [Sulfurospirillaceae bacterium]|nr:hypothetical protein [Sulfurospirillaceae bacterium]